MRDQRNKVEFKACIIMPTEKAHKMCLRSFTSVPMKSKVPLGVLSWGGDARVGNLVLSEGVSILSQGM